MTNCLKDKKRAFWLILLPAAAVSVIHIALLHRYGVDECGVRNYAWYNVSDYYLDCLIVWMMLCAWRVRKTDFSRGLLLGTLSAFTYFCTLSPRMYDLVEFVNGLLALAAPFLVWSVAAKLRGKLEKGKAAVRCGVLWAAAVFVATIAAAFLDGSESWLAGYLVFPAAVVIAEGCVCIWLSVREYGDKKTREKWLWRAWLGCLALTVCITSELSTELRFWASSCWGAAAEAAMPILYALLLRLLRRSRNGALTLALYYGFCLFTVHAFGLGLFGLVMPILICAFESRDSGQKTWRTAAISALYALAWAALCYFRDDRLREIVYDLGGPAVNISAAGRINWLGYRLAAVKSFFAGNFDAFSAVSGLPYEEYPGYLAYTYTDRLGPLLYRFGRVWLPVLMLLVITAAVLLLRSGHAQPRTGRRNRQYMAVGYLLRAALACLYIVTMTWNGGRDFPFLAQNPMDLLMLCLLLRWDTADAAQPDGAEDAAP